MRCRLQRSSTAWRCWAWASTMTSALKLFIVAGEPSGDRIAADLVARLRQRVPLALAGVGGDELKAMGLVSLYPMSDLSVMGISDVLRRLPLLLWRAGKAGGGRRGGAPEDVAV